MSQKECQSKKNKGLASRKEIYRFSDSNVKTGIISDGEKKWGILGHSLQSFLFCLCCWMWCKDDGFQPLFGKWDIHCIGVKPEAAIGGRDNMVDHNGPISQLPTGRKILQFAITSEIAQTLILSVILANYCLHSRYSKLTQHRLDSQLVKKKDSAWLYQACHLPKLWAECCFT